MTCMSETRSVTARNTQAGETAARPVLSGAIDAAHSD
jgi:hypothetical protein